jgi:nucleotide-binding universal stress UspA family protein
MTKETTTTERSIVVGVDGSDSSKAALAWASKQALLTDTPVVAIATWEWPTTYGTMEPWPENIDFEADARDTLKRSVDQILGPERCHEVIQRVIHGQAAAVLEDASRSAALLVVGSRGHGEFASILLGSVSEFLATHAHCPIVIVRGDIERSDREGEPATA